MGHPAIGGLGLTSSGIGLDGYPPSIGVGALPSIGLRVGVGALLSAGLLGQPSHYP